MLRVVIDTNVVVSALNFGGNPKTVLELARKNHLQTITSPFILNEMEKVLTQKFGWQMEATREVISDFQKASYVVDPPETLDVINYPPDNRILECALAGEADYLVSGDHHLTDLKNFEKNKIVTLTTGRHGRTACLRVRQNCGKRI
jgi:putative PIN family toxin of toxin-antitoxin system